MRSFALHLLFDSAPVSQGQRETFYKTTIMKSGAKLKATEERLEEIRKAAAEAAQVPAGVRPSAESPQTREGESYYGLPALKPPVWTWEVPLYFFLGGIAGLSAGIGFAAQLLS